MTDDERAKRIAELALRRRVFLDAYQVAAQWLQIRAFSGITDHEIGWSIALAHGDAIAVVNEAARELAKATAALFPPPPPPPVAPAPTPTPDRSKN